MEIAVVPSLDTVELGYKINCRTFLTEMLLCDNISALQIRIYQGYSKIYAI